MGGDLVPTRPLARRVSRATATEVVDWIAARVEAFLEVNSTAVDVHGDCPRRLCWRSLRVEIEQHFGRISDLLSVSVRTRVFEKLLNMVNPAYYLSVDPRGFKMERFINTLRSQFDPSLETRIPRFDLKGKQYPVTLDDMQGWDRVERRCLCGPSRVLWEQICDFLDRQLTVTELGAKPVSGTMGFRPGWSWSQSSAHSTKGCTTV